MRVLFLIIVTFSISSYSADSSATELTKRIMNGLNVELLAALKTLDSNSDRVGYGLCRRAGRSDCDPDGTLGYGLCREAGRSDCDSDGTLGYGLCRVAGRSDCASEGSVGYGICRVAGRSDCAID